MRRYLSDNYLEQSQNFPHLNTFWLPSAKGKYGRGKYGIPSLPTVEIEPDEFWPYDERRKNEEYDYDLPKNVALHFFMSDHGFNGVWTYANKTLGSISRFDCVISPDFSMYRQWPLVIQMWNTYRSRWLGAWWDNNGIPVIPSVNWSTEESYDFCFEGLPVGGTFAIATMELDENNPIDAELFLHGFQEMIRRCQPNLVLVYGQGFANQLEEMALIRRYPHRYAYVLDHDNSDG